MNARSSNGLLGVNLVLASIVGLPGFASAHDFQIGDVICGISGGNYHIYDNSGVYLETIYNGLGGVTTGASFRLDPATPPGRLYLTDFSSSQVVVMAGSTGHAILQTINTGAAGGWFCESIVLDAAGNFLVGNAAGSQDIQKYGPSGSFLASFDVGTGPVGSDWVDLACDMTTMFYTSEGQAIRRFDLGTSTQLPDFATGLPNDSFQLVLLPPLDGSGGLLVANRMVILRLDATGTIAQTYDVSGEDFWFSVCLDPNGTSFWAGDLGSANFYRFAIASGAVEVGPVNTGTGYGTFTGMTVVGAPSAGANEPPVFEQAPCGKTIPLTAGLPHSYVISCVDPDPGDAITLTATGVPPGATHAPALPLVGAPDQDLAPVFSWTPTVADAGTHVIQYLLQDSGCASAMCKVTLQVAESYLILGTAPGTDIFTVGGHSFPTQISSLREWYPATPEVTPAFEAPPLSKVWFRPGPYGSSGGSGLALLDSFTVQALQYDPLRFPSNPEQYSGGLQVRIWNSGQITASPYGQADGMTVELEVFVDGDGKRYYRFPMTIQ